MNLFLFASSFSLSTQKESVQSLCGLYMYVVVHKGEVVNRGQITESYILLKQLKLIQRESRSYLEQGVK